MKVFHALGLFEGEDLDYGAVGIRVGRGSRGDHVAEVVLDDTSSTGLSKVSSLLFSSAA